MYVLSNRCNSFELRNIVKTQFINISIQHIKLITICFLTYELFNSDVLVGTYREFKQAPLACNFKLSDRQEF